MKILAVCLGNICRSPLAEGILRREIESRNLDWTVDSAGTGGWHTGEHPDPRSVAIARRYGLDITDQRARQVQIADLDDFDLILAMDESNYVDLRRLAHHAPRQQEKIFRITEYAFPEEHPENVPDPYWNDDGFEQVYQMLLRAAGRVIERALAEITPDDQQTTP
jgi:protein-tyrosine phosphatase